MTTSAFRKELHKKIDSINDNAVLEAIYTILNHKTESYSLTSGQLSELDKRNELHETGQAKYYTMAEMKKKVVSKKKK